MYSTANERGYISTVFFVYLSANCGRDVCDPSNDFLLYKKLSYLFLKKVANTYFAKQISVSGYEF
ncbi:MAG: hypothetical protein LBP59_11920 [Planctomycetaceae bacterium]|nr:hypothetical protein [Planctomycetaceae bacterium]